MPHGGSVGKSATWMAALALAVVLAPTVLGAQDLTLVMTTTANGRQTQSTQYISSTKGTRSGTGDGSEVILRLDEQKMYIIHPREKTYNVMTFDEMQKMAAAATSAPDLPPEMAAQMKKMMGGMGGGVTVTHVGPGESIAGYATEKYHVTMGSMMEGDIWTAPALPMPAMFYDAMKAATPSNPMFDMKKAYEEYKTIKGVPLKSVTTSRMMGQSMTTTMVVSSVDKSPIPASTFEVPAGFRLQATAMK